jgi:hypothetical protein
VKRLPYTLIYIYITTVYSLFKSHKLDTEFWWQILLPSQTKPSKSNLCFEYGGGFFFDSHPHDLISGGGISGCDNSFMEDSGGRESKKPLVAWLGSRNFGHIAQK